MWACTVGQHLECPQRLESMAGFAKTLALRLSRVRPIKSQLQKIVGRRYVLSSRVRKAPYCSGYRFGKGSASLVVRPGTLLELWKVLKVCVDADVVIIMQAANTGLTGGSTPLSSYDRNAVVVNTLRIRSIIPILGGEQVVCLAGATLQSLEETLESFGREPHSVLGSSCIGASVIGGVCNNSGGSLVKRGPAYTELSLYAQLSETGELELVNHLGIHLGNTPAEILDRLDQESVDRTAIEETFAAASDKEYKDRVRDVSSAEPARYNGDSRRYYESSGSAGKLAVFAVRLDTFPINKSQRTFFVSTNDTAALAAIRRSLLDSSAELPTSAEYIHSDALDLAVRYGNDTVWIIDKLGTRRIPWLFRTRSLLEAVVGLIAGKDTAWVERCLQIIGRLLPSRAPSWLGQSTEEFQHHLIIKSADDEIASTRKLLQSRANELGYFVRECNERDARLVSLLRFAAAGAAIRYEAVKGQSVAGIVALDIALPRNTLDWFEILPDNLESRIEKKLYYGHFLCHVLHQDYIIRSGECCDDVKRELLALLEARGAKYPAEHNFGHTYEAPDDTKQFYHCCDPTNSFNPGVGGMSTRKFYR